MATWTGSVLGGVTSAPYAGLGLDRLPERREDPGSVAALAADPRSRVVPLWRDLCLVAGDPPRPLVLPVGAIDDADHAQMVLLGLDNETPYFAVDLSDLGPDEALEHVGADAAADIRAVFADLPAARAGILAYARGLTRRPAATRFLPVLWRRASRWRTRSAGKSWRRLASKWVTSAMSAPSHGRSRPG
jgi:hypothetical protein